jgi:NSS family neurotransmitter:Na+ symporter
MLVRVERKEHWGSRRTFILAAIGAAIGIGNVWRFPFIVYSNGGGAFIIPYIIALITAGIPLLMMEFGLGYKAKAGAPISFRALIGPRFEWIGWLAVLVGFAIITYYSIILAWAVDYIFFSTNLAYQGNTELFFFDSFLQLPNGLLPLGEINSMIVLGALISWLWVFISIIKGVRSVEKMVYITVLVPWIIILIFVLRGITLPGAWDGISYLIKPDFNALLKPDVWLAAYGQIFFTLSLGWGVMIAYASYLPEKSDLAKNAVIIAVVNSLTSLIAALAVFSTLGYLAFQSGVPVTEVVRGGIELTFVTYPTVIQLLPLAPRLFGMLFFLMILTLGVDSAFATIEATSIPIIEQFKKPRILVNIFLCSLGFGIGLIFATRAGFYWLEIVDYYLSTVLLVIVGLLEAVAVGYFYGPEILRKFLGDQSEIVVGRWWNYSIKIIVPGMLFFILLSIILENINEPYGGYPLYANVLGWFIVIVIPVLSVIIAVGVQIWHKNRSEKST